MQYLFAFIFLSVTISVLRDLVKKCWPNLQIKFTFGHYLVLLNVEIFFGPSYPPPQALLLFQASRCGGLPS